MPKDNGARAPDQPLIPAPIANGRKILYIYSTFGDNLLLFTMVAIYKSDDDCFLSTRRIEPASIYRWRNLRRVSMVLVEPLERLRYWRRIADEFPDFRNAGGRGDRKLEKMNLNCTILLMIAFMRLF